MISEPISFDNELDALTEIKNQREANPEKIHSLKFEDGNLKIISYTLDHYMDEVYFKQTGERPANLTSQILKFYNNFLGALPVGKSSRQS